MEAKLLRIEQTDEATIGILMTDGRARCMTLEPPWLNNKVNISCIPVGVYQVVRVNSPKYGETFMVKNVSGRSHILFHKGNTVNDTKGCILTGQYCGWLHGKRAVKWSRDAYYKLMKTLAKENGFTLIIEDI